MAVQYTDFSIPQGASFRALVRIASGSGGPIDLSSASLSGQLRTDYGVVRTAATLSFQMVDAPSGTFYILMTPAQTLALSTRKYYYDVNAMEGADIFRLLEGSIFVRSEVTR